MGLSEIQDVVGAVTDLQQETARNYRHKTIIGDCVRLFMERKLVELTTLVRAHPRVRAAAGCGLVTRAVHA